MRTLLSFPPNVVNYFHDITQLPRKDWFCTSDPADRKLGSGGGTTWLLEACQRDEGGEEDFATWLAKEKRILLHAGGQSRRLPCYAPSGKVLTPIPAFRWARGQRIDQTLLDLQMPLYEEIIRHAPASLRTLIASGDVYLRATEPLQEIPEADVVCYGLWADPALASHHGVFLMDRERPEVLDFMLQKPSTDEQARWMQTHYSLMDIGVWLLSDKAVELLRERSKDQNGEWRNYDLYSEFGCALGTHPSRPDAALNSLKVAILPLPGGEFYHFGTAPELLSSTMAVQNLVKDQRYIIQRNVKRHPSLFTQNSVVLRHADATNQYVWVENSFIAPCWRYTDHNIITGVPRNDWALHLPSGICIDVVPIGDDAYALRPYGYYDAFRGSAEDTATHYLGRPWKEWLAARGIAPEALGNTADLQAAPLFPVVKTVEELRRWFEWMTGEGDPSLTTVWLATRRLSADELSTHANLARLVAQRRAFRKENLSALADNWQKSIFYQVNLKDMAQKFAEEHLPLPQPLPADAPLMTRIHDAMFRSEKLRNEANAESALYEQRAFSLLREGLTEEALHHKSAPRMTTCSDQIVWGRSPVRIDLAGGWTDTPPYSLMAGGNVINLAIELNGQPPLQVYVKPCKEPVVICRSIDLGAMERITSYEELAQYNRVGSPFSIPKAALSLAGFLPGFGQETFPTLQAHLESFGCGIEITLLSAIPAGSGLGTSSILAATVLGALSDFCGLGWDANEVCHRVLVLEQLLTTGGGWQDQYGGVLPGIKLLQTSSGFRQTPVTRWLPDTLFTAPEYAPCHLLYYTGITRTAKNILAEIVRGMFLNSTTHLNLLSEMKQHTLAMYEALQKTDMQEYGCLLRRTWSQNRRLDSGTNPPAVQTLCEKIDDFCLGYKLPGAGGGGYLYMLAKDAEAARRIRETLQAAPLAANARFVDMTVSHTGFQVSRS